MHYLYEIVNTENDKKYIGATGRPKLRFREHLLDSNPCPKIKKAMDEIGRDNFSFNILCIGERDYILELEVKCIALYDSVLNGYNSYSRNGVFVKTYVFVAGFWFPDYDTAVAALSMNKASFYNWLDRGVLENCHTTRYYGNDAKVVYIRGFWFTSVTLASKILSISTDTIRNLTNRGYVEQFVPHGMMGSGNHMYGKTGKYNVNSKPVYVDNKFYHSIACAVRESGFSEKVIYNRLKKKVDGFRYANP